MTWPDESAARRSSEAGAINDPKIVGEALLVDARGACRALAIGRSKLAELTRTRALPSLTIGRARRYRVADLEAFVAERVAGAGEGARHE